jgi:hypothetical protein
MGERRGSCGVLEGNPEGTRLLGKCMHRWTNNNKLYLQEVGLWA